MFNLSKHDAKFVEPEFYVDPLDERFTGVNNEILPLIIGAITAGLGAYAAHQQGQAARRAEDIAAQRAQQAREEALARLAQMKADAQQRSKEFQASIAQSQAQTAQAAQAAEMAQQSAMAQIAQQKRSSALAIQQQQLQSSIQRQATTAPVAQKVRRRVGTPQALRTSLEISSPLAGAPGGAGATTTTGTGGLNV